MIFKWTDGVISPDWQALRGEGGKGGTMKIENEKIIIFEAVG